MSVITNNVQLGSSPTATNNFTITAEAANGTMKLARGNAGATTQDIFTVDASGNITPTGNILGGVLGVGQTWQSVIGSRVAGTTYTNTTGKPIVVSVYQSGAGTNANLSLTVGGVLLAFAGNGSSQQTYQTVTAIVPNGTTYVVNVTGGQVISGWVELR